MKILDQHEKWSDKVNFVDVNNVFVGYNLSQDCCEHADWFISDKQESEARYEENEEERKVPDVTSYNFDKEYFETVQVGGEFDGGGMVRFRLVAEDKPDLYLHLYNIHNGYYSHGFEFKINDTVIQSGSI